MSKKAKRKNESLLGGSSFPASLLRRRVAQVERSLNAQFKEKGALRQDAGKYLRTLQQTISSGASANEEVSRAAAGLRSFSERLAKRKVVSPAVPRVRSGIVFGQYVVNFAPPQYNPLTRSGILDGNPTVSDTADANTGQMNLSVVSDYENPSEAWAWAELYITFDPPFGPGTLSASANPSILFSWWVNAIQDFHVDALSEASLSFGIITNSRSTGSLVGQNINTYELWSEMQTDQFDFDFGSRTVPVSAEMNIGEDDECYVFLNCMCHVVALGWPPQPTSSGIYAQSLAGAKVALTLPSITLDLEWHPVFGPVSAR
jgi:hypothetical protein